MLICPDSSNHSWVIGSQSFFYVKTCSYVYCTTNLCPCIDLQNHVSLSLISTLNYIRVWWNFVYFLDIVLTTLLWWDGETKNSRWAWKFNNQFSNLWTQCMHLSDDIAICHQGQWTPRTGPAIDVVVCQDDAWRRCQQFIISVQQQLTDIACSAIYRDWNATWHIQRHCNNWCTTTSHIRRHRVEFNTF